MLISRKPVEFRKKGLSKADSVRDASQVVHKLLRGLAGCPISARPYSEPGGHVPANEVKAIFYSGIHLPDIEHWIKAFEKTLLAAGKELKGKLVHYTLTLQPGEAFTDETASAALVTLAEEMGYGNADDYLTMSFWHAASETPEHLHMVACRVNLRDKGILMENDGWYQLGMQKARAKIECLYGFDSSRKAAIIFRDGEYLCRASTDYENSTGLPSEERRMKAAAREIAREIREGVICNWEGFFRRCAESGMTYVLGPRGGGRLRAVSGFEILPSFWIPNLARGNLEATFDNPFPVPVPLEDTI